MTKYSNGTVLEIAKDGKVQYWKILGCYSKGNKTYESYQVIRCSKTGKEFRETNGFQTSWIDNAVAVGDIKVMTNSAAGTKADIDDGIESGKKKRRISYLQARIESDTKELEMLRKSVCFVVRNPCV